MARAAIWMVLVAALVAAGATVAAWAARSPSAPRSVGVLADRAPAGPASSTAPTTTTTTPSETSPAVPLPKRDRDLLGSHSARLEDLPRRASLMPVSVGIDRPGIAGPVVAVGVDGAGEMAVGSDPGTVAWYQHGPSPGEDGSSVLAGHVDYGGRTGVFFRLTEVTPGAVVVVTYADQSQRRFTVVARRQYPKSDLPVAEIFARTGPPQLVLVTCGGEFDDAARSYRENVVVYAVPA